MGLPLFFFVSSPHKIGKPWNRTKVIVYGALAYLVLPVNLISVRRFRFLGLADEALAIAIAYKKIKQHVTPEMEQEAEATLDKWFSR